MTMPTMQLSAADRTRLEHFLLDFDQNWTEQHLGIMVGLLAPESQEYRVVALTELVKIELDHLQQRGDAVKIDPYLERFSELKESDHLVADLLQAEIELRNDAGNLPSATELKQRFPALQSRIDSMLAEAASNLEASRVRRAKRKHLKEDTQSSGSTTSLAAAAQETLPPGPRKPSRPAKSDGLEGDQFGRYRLLRELGRGAMGTVYLAEDTELRRQVAIKRPRLAGTEEASMMERFYREAYAAATLDHPNICPVYDIGTHEGIPFITMAYVDGKPLSKVIRESERLNPRAVASLVRKIAIALAEAHAKGVIHRDLKPGNIMLNHRNEPIVMDFGLARQVEHADDRLTADGTLIGTPGYMSPEQVEGDLNAVGCPSDIYSLGVVLFELLTGELPFRGSVTSVIGQILRDDSPSPSSLRAELPKELDDICMKMMAKAPADRFASMSEVSRALAAFIKSSGDSATVASPPQIEELTVARLEAQKNEITQQIADGNWREASLQLQRMCELTEPIAASYVRWATEQSTALHARWQQEQQASVQSIRTAKQQFATQDYAAAAQTLLTIDKQLLTTEGKQLLAESLKLQEEVDLLIHLIEQGLQTGKQPGMVKNLQRLMALKSKDPLARDLYRKYRWQQRLGWLGGTMADAFSFAVPSRTRATLEEPMLRKWFVMAAVVFVLSFGLMSWAVMIYLRGPNQTIAVEVADELISSGGITLAVDGDDHVITGPNFELKLTLGEHDFTVRQGDTVIHNPQSFTIEKEGRQVLNITPSVMNLGVWAPETAVPSPENQANSWQVSPPTIASPDSDALFEGHTLKDEWSQNSLGIQFVWIPGGHFRMGSELTPPLEANEDPVEVHITRGMWVATTELTQGQWKPITGTAPWMAYQDKRVNDKNAATHMTWNEAVDYCQRFTDRERRAGNIPIEWEFRLPSEAEWEYFCRAGTFDAYCFGNDVSHLGEYAWWKENTQDLGEGYAHEVGKLKPNAWGLYDVHGNVYELCYDSYVSRLPGGADPCVTEPTDARKISRGGGWAYFGPEFARCSNRRHLDREDRRNSMGMRLVLAPVSRISATGYGRTPQHQRRSAPSQNLAAADWSILPASASTDWVLDKDVLRAERGEDMSIAWTNKTFSDFELSFEIKCSQDANGGVLLRAPTPHATFQNVFEVHFGSGRDGVLPGTKHPSCGGLYLSNSLQSPDDPGGQANSHLDIGADVAAYKENDWNHVKIQLVGAVLSVELNGQLVLWRCLSDLAIPYPHFGGTLNRASGYIGLQCFLGTISYRNVSVQPVALTRPDKTISTPTARESGKQHFPEPTKVGNIDRGLDWTEHDELFHKCLGLIRSRFTDNTMHVQPQANTSRIPSSDMVSLLPQTFLDSG